MMNFDVDLVKSFILAEDWKMAIALLESAIYNSPEKSNYYWYLGIIYLLQDQVDLAENVWMASLFKNHSSNTQKLMHELLMLLEDFALSFLEKNKLIKASRLLASIKNIDIHYHSKQLDECIKKSIDFNLTKGISLAQKQDKKNAEICFQEILTLEPTHSHAWYNLAIFYYKNNLFQESLQAINQAISIKKDYNYLYILGNILESIDDFQNAIIAYQESIKVFNNFYDAYINLGNCYKKIKDYSAAKKIYNQAININQSHCGAYLNLGKILLLEQNYEKSINYFNQASLKESVIPELYETWCDALNKVGNYQQALKIGVEGIQKFPMDLCLKRKVSLLLPIIYQSIQEISDCRQRFQNELEYLVEDLEAQLNQKQGNLNNLIKYIWNNKTGETNYYLAYQGKNDIEIQKRYAYFVEKIVKNTDFYFDGSDYFKTLDSTKIRIGYLSQKLSTLFGNLISGWPKNHDKNQFIIYSYDLGTEHDQIIHSDFQNYSDYYYKLNHDISKICNQIIQDKINVLVFIDIGMSPITTILAAMRLAPIQCTTWAHPITSGFTTIDYFLSSDLMESEHAIKHYSEKLIRLPNLGITYSKPLITDTYGESRKEDYGIQKSDVIYLCCQHISKYLPQYDYIFSKIAQKVCNAKFIFIESHEGTPLLEKFKRRIRDSFIQNSEDFSRCLFLPRLTYQDYFKLLKSSDIFLDTFLWSGGVTSLDAIACSLPVVTCPGELMRSRQSYGILYRIGVTETIANDELNYINIAIRLGNDAEWRQTVRDKIRLNSYKLYDDLTPLTYLEKFFQETVKNYYSPINS